MNRFGYARATSLEQALRVLHQWYGGQEAEGGPRDDGPATEPGPVSRLAKAGPGIGARTAVPLAVLAGGTDLLTLMKGDLLAPERLLDVSGVPELGGMAPAEDGGWRLGALVTLSQLAEPGALPSPYRALAQAAAASATPALRNRATLGGNLEQQVRCWYFRTGLPCLLAGDDHCACTGPDAASAYHAIFGHGPGEPGGGCAAVHPSDPAVALVALGATVRLARWTERGLVEREVPVEEYFTGLQDTGLRDTRPQDTGLQGAGHRAGSGSGSGPGPDDPGPDGTGTPALPRLTARRPDELIVEVRLPRLPAGSASVYRKLMGRRTWQFALVSLAMWVDFGEDADKGGTGGSAGRIIRDARVVLGGVAIKPWRLHAVEELLRGRRPDALLAEEAAAVAVEGARPLAQNAYKVELVRGLVAETVASWA
ncbi:MAG TPA: FAD binding domain-containing protein [Thermaerobacter sp.]